MIEFRFRDVDGDELAIFTADIPGVGAGVNIRTTGAGVSVPFREIPALLDAIREIADHAGARVEVPW